MGMPEHEGVIKSHDTTQHVFMLKPEVVDPFLGKMEIPPTPVPSESENDSAFLGVIEGTKTQELGA